MENTSKNDFHSLLANAGIKKVYFIDDYLPEKFDIDNILAAVAELLAKMGEDLFVEKLSECIDLKRTPVDEISNAIRKFCEEANDEHRDKIKEIVLGLTDDEYLKQSEQTTKIVKLFPESVGLGIRPELWDELRENSLKKDIELGRVLILFDLDLSKAPGFTNRTGVDLIRELKKDGYLDKITCILISHDILETSNELSTRQKLIEEFGFTEADFFPLSKKRLDIEDHFYDGIKKSLLNAHCELIKLESTKIIHAAYSQALNRIKEINTYDFDHTIFQSSYEEGIWEAETLFRIAGILFDEEIKKQIIDTEFQKRINLQIRESKKLSDVRFRIGKHIEPYSEKYRLRHSEIYENGTVINRLYKPLENGDIFEIYEGHDDCKGLYILIGQECDFMVRNPDGKREANLGYLYKIHVYDSIQFNEMIGAHYKDYNIDYFDSKFKLEYITPKTDDVGLVSLKNPLVVDLKVLDLIVFNSSGEAKRDINTDFDTSVLSFAWEARYRRNDNYFKTESGRINSAFAALKGITDRNIKESLIAKNRLRLSPVRPEAGKVVSLQKSVFDFGIRRVLNFRRPGSAILLDKLTKYQSRHATLHDFAIMK